MKGIILIERLILLHPLDNVQMLVDPSDEMIGIGHKVARQFIAAGEKIIKYGVPIGSATKDIQRGSHVHVHNMKSDYISTYTIDLEFKGPSHRRRKKTNT